MQLILALVARAHRHAARRLDVGVIVVLLADVFVCRAVDDVEVQGLVLADVETRSGVTFEGFYASGSDTYGHAWWWLRYCHGIGRSLACMLLRCAMCGYYQVHARVPAAVDVRR